MTAGLDYLMPYADTVTPGSARKIEERRHGGWLLELERALLENEVTRNAPRFHHDGMERHRNDAGTYAGAESASAGQARDGEPTVTIAQLVQARSEATGAQGDTAQASTVQQSAMENGRQDDAPLQHGVARSGAAVSIGFYPIDISYRLPVQQQAVNSNDEILNVVTQQDLRQSRTLMQRGTTGATHFAAEYPARAEGEMEADGAVASQSTLPFLDSEAYARRKLHLFHTEDGVQAWIRDTDVTEPGVYAIASALNAELAASGLKLSALTFNGKRLAQLFPDVRLEGEERAAAAVSMVTETETVRAQIAQHITEKGAY
ncbi:MAG TPA: hypothetical protein VEC35_14580 [Noviherbaspirillum sp.]|nr:hypothetical protein [Noviherbaspirillum sp.]